MKSIGGFQELELNEGIEFHSNAIRLNTARNALEYILLACKIKKIYIPFYICDVILQPLVRTGIKWSFYNINEDFEPDFDFSIIKTDESFLYVNYFGLNEKNVKKLVLNVPNLIIDNSQAFYSKPYKGVFTIYSPRKFFGLSDGAYLYSQKKVVVNLDTDISFQRFQHLLKRIDISPESSYTLFQANEEALNNQPLRKMSNLTLRLLKSINYEEVAGKRRQNYSYLESNLNSTNEIKFNLDEQVPLVYPYLPNKTISKEYLIKNKIYIATYWSNVLNWVNKTSFEYYLVKNLINLPIDQRYCNSDMANVLKVVL